MKRYEVVLFDFHGVLSKDHFYAGLEGLHPGAHEFVETRVFGGASDIPSRWMRGELTSDDVNRHVSESTGVSLGLLRAAFLDGVRRMRVDARLLDFAMTLRADGVAVGLVTDNMDVFDEVVIARHALDRVFQAIVNSCDYGRLKHEDDGRLFDVAMKLLGHAGRYDSSLLIDDSATDRAIFARKGGDVYAYSDYAAFRRWADAAFGLG